MLKISAVIMTTSVFAGLLASGPSGLMAAETSWQIAAINAQTAAVKVKTFVVHEDAGLTSLAQQFALPRADRLTRTRYLRRPSVASKVRTMRGA